jgi:methylenetetrahydrofolate reductase (NADPH)
MKLLLKDLIEGSDFIYGLEAVTTRGVLHIEGDNVQRFAADAMDTGLFDFISFTDNPGGNPHLAPEAIGRALLEKGHNVNIHITCKDRNRNALESRAWSLASEGFTNVLALSGDYPAEGYRGTGRPVFDIDSVGLLNMYCELSNGLEVAAPRKDKSIQLSGTKFLLSATVSPFKKYESEYLSQYFKMEKKIRAGARFFIIQVGYDARKWSELIQYARLNRIRTPFIANIYLLTKGVAQLFYDNKITGCVVTPALLEIARKQALSPDKGKSFFLEFAARQIAIAQGLGFRGCYLGGVHNMKELLAIREKTKSYGPDDWKEFYKELSFPQAGEFYLYGKDGSGFALPEFSESYIKSKRKAGRFLRRIFTPPPAYRLSSVVHRLVFIERSPLYRALKTFYRLIDGKKCLEKFFHFFERTAKACLYGCNDCGDCSLFEIAYLCPESKCSKNQRNGPCGGSHQGVCEVGDKMCIWYKAYGRLSPLNREDAPFAGGITITDARLLNTSAWQNFFLKRDHACAVINIRISNVENIKRPIIRSIRKEKADGIQKYHRIDK